MTIDIPPSIAEYLNQNIKGRIALIGCRAQNVENSFECCEYDIALLDPNDPLDRVVELEDSVIEFLNFSSRGNQHRMQLESMIPIGYKNMPLFSPSFNSTNVSTDRIFMGQSKKMIVNALFNIERADGYKESNVELSSLHLKIAAYHLLEGILLCSGIRPMPTHELNQIRALDEPNEAFATAIKSGLECLGIERASKTTINRSYKALKEILREEDDKHLIFSKIEYLLANGLLADCYYFIGKVGMKYLDRKNDKFAVLYPKLSRLTFDLNLDIGLIRKTSLVLKDSCKMILKS
jgi:hypothetical protein